MHVTVNAGLCTSIRNLDERLNYANEALVGTFKVSNATFFDRHCCKQYENYQTHIHSIGKLGLKLWLNIEILLDKQFNIR